MCVYKSRKVCLQNFAFVQLCMDTNVHVLACQGNEVTKTHAKSLRKAVSKSVLFILKDLSNSSHRGESLHD